MRKYMIIGFAALLALALVGCGPKEKTDEVTAEMPSTDECKAELTEYLTGINTWEDENAEAPNDEIITKFTEAATELKTKSATWAAYGDDYAEVSGMAATAATYYEASVAFTSLDQATAPPEEVDLAFNNYNEAHTAMEEVNKELGLE